MAVLTGSGELDIGYKGKMFGQPVCKYTLEHVIPDGESPEEGKMIRAAYQKLWEAGMNKLKKERAATIKKAMDDTEKAIAKKPPTNMQAFIDTANKLIQQGVDVFRQVEIVKLAEECLSKVYDAVEKALKKKVTRQKVKTVLKIIALVLITLAVAAATIAGTVLTGGALAAVVLGSIATGVGALVASGKIIAKEYSAYNGILDKIKKDIEEIDKAIAYQKKKEKDAANRSLGPKEKIKLMLAGTAPLVKKLNGHLEEAEGKIILARGEMAKAVVKADEAKAEFEKMATANDKEISAEAAKAKEVAYKAARAVEKMMETETKFKELKAEAKKQIAEIEKNGDWNGGNINKLVKFAEAHAELVSFLVSAASALKTAFAKISKAIK
jgi:hypothetical protein